jgi:hypothetical protein
MNAHLDRRTVLALAAGATLASRSVWGVQVFRTGGDMTTSIEAACTAYLDAWARKDLSGIAARLHPAVRFKGPMQELNGRESVLAAAERVFPLLERFETWAQFVSRDRAMFAYDFICREPIGVCPTAELVRFEDGLIRDIQLFFDARPFEAFQRAQAQRTNKS